MTATLELLTPDQCAEVHERSLHILETVGMRCDSAQGRRLLGAAGARVDEGTGHVRFPRALVEESLAMAPRDFALGGRRPGFSVPMNAGACTLANDGQALLVLDYESGEYRHPTMEAWRAGTRLCDALDEYGTLWEMVSPRDDASITGFLDFQIEVLRNYSKNAPAAIESPAEGPWLLETLEIVFGGRDELRRVKPCSSGICPISPLIIEGPGIDMWLTLRGYEIPCVIMPMPLMGATAPASLLSTVLLANCEVLGPLTLMQVADPGSPVIYAPTVGTMDPRSGRYQDGAAHAALEVGLIEMGRHYGLPVMGTGPVDDAFVPGTQWAYERMFAGLYAGLAWPDVMVWGGTAGGATIYCLEHLLLDAEMWRLVRKAHEGIVVDDERWLDDVLARVGPGGSFIGERSTRSNAHSGEWFFSRLGVHEPLEAWQAHGRSDILDEAHEKVHSILAAHEPLPLGDDVERELAKLRARATRAQ
jgi:trimethylamine--corrinoid protein Co-methyltransferase